MKKNLLTLICIMSINMANAQWTTANLSIARGMSATTVGTKAFFAGDGAVVDIYDNSTGLWTTANLSVARAVIGATAVGTKVFFAGGVSLNGFSYSVVDIYDNSTGLWTTDNLSVSRSGLGATAVGTKAFFAGGVGAGFNPSSVVDIYDNTSTGINANSKNEGIKVYPNPTTGELFLSDNYNASLTDITGKIVMQVQNSNAIDISIQPAGMYFILLTDNKGQIVQRSKVVKE